MKATLIISAVIFFAALAGCSDNFGPNEPINTGDNSAAQTTQSNENGNIQPSLVWSKDELAIKAFSESTVERKAAFILAPYFDNASYIISFQGSTNADKFINGYEPLVQVTKDGQVLFEGFNERSINGYNEIKLENVRFNEIKFYIALFEADRDDNFGFDKIPGEPAVLQLSDLKIYRTN